MAREPWFASLGAEAALADVQVRQTLAMGLVPLGIALLLMAAGAPEEPSPALWAGAGAAVAGMALLWGLWRMSGQRHWRGFSTVHFLVRYLFVVLCPVLLWIVFGETILDLGGWFPPVLLGLLLLLYPARRILRERAGANPLQAPHVEMAYLLCRQIEMVMLAFALMGLLSGAILDANRDYPTDPTPLLILLWILAFMAVLAGVVMGAAHWARLFGRRHPPQPLDDEPPAAEPPKNRGRFGSDKF
ncbi:MAG: hypothetical protein AB7V14_11515 [Kiritimatiellia bacterium]